MKVVVIIPTYNERENIIELLTKLERAKKKITNHQLHFLVVDDNSPDGTQDLVRKFAKDYPHVYLITGQKQGLGKALLRGMHHAVDKLGAEIIAQIDADLSHDPLVLPQFIKVLDRGADFAVGSRYIPGGSIPPNWAIHRKIYSVIGNSIVRYGLGFPAVHDWTGGYRAYYKKYFEAAKETLARYRGYVFQIALLHKSVLNGAKVVEVPIHFTDRRFGHSKIAPSEYIRNVLEYVALARLVWLRHSPFGKFLVVGTIGFIVNTVVLELLVWWGIHPAVGSAVGAELAIVSNFILNNRWTFRQRRVTGWRLLPKFLQFNLTSVGAILLQAGTVWVGVSLFGVASYRLFYILGVGLGLVWNYTMYSQVIWKK